MTNEHRSAPFKVAGRAYASASPLVIAEIGTGHGGSLAKGRELVAAAAAAGADCVKFQHVYADEIIHPNTGLVPLPGGPVPLFDRFRALETGPGFLAAMKDEAERRGLIFLCTPFGLRSARELRELGVAAMKLASPELNHLPLIGELASYGLPTIVSSGVSTLGDIEAAVSTFRAAGPAYESGSGGLALLHCVTAYPAPESDYNLRVLSALASLFGLATGVSDHSTDPVIVPALAVSQGAAIVEKHICLSRDDPGLDDPIALDPEGFKAMVQAVRAAAADPAGTPSRLASTYGEALIEATLGHGRKELAPSERANYGRTNRSVHVLRGLKAGERLTADKLALLRTEKLLRPGLPPALLPGIVGRLAARDIPAGEGVEWADLGAP